MDYTELEKKIGYQFQNTKHLDIAFTHKSFSNENMLKNVESYERYEFLGDAILELIVSQFLFEEYKDLSEGELTKLRASLVCEYTLSKIARDLEFGRYGRFSHGERKTGGFDRDSILCDMFESVLGAIYLDSGRNLTIASRYVKEFLLTDIEHKRLFHDSKSRLQELVQKQNGVLEYQLISQDGPDHNKEFRVQVCVNEKVISKGIGHSKKQAEQVAAFEALRILM